MYAEHRLTNTKYDQRFKATEERFWEKVVRGKPTECWIWKGAINSAGYGIISMDNRLTTARRLVIELLTDDDLAPGQRVLNTCNTRLCVNPAHLQLQGTQQHKLSEHDRRAIRIAHKKGRATRTELARLYHTTYAKVCRVLDTKAKHKASPPHRLEIKQARLAVFMDYAEAAEIAGVKLNTWKGYEYGVRAIPLTRWRRFLEDTGQTTRLAAMDAIAAADTAPAEGDNSDPAITVSPPVPPSRQKRRAKQGKTKPGTGFDFGPDVD